MFDVGSSLNSKLLLSHLLSKDSGSTYHIELLWGFSEIMHFLSDTNLLWNEVLQPQCLWRVRQDNSLCGTGLCIVGCLPAFPFSTVRCQYHPQPPLWQTKMSPDLPNVPWEVKSPLVEKPLLHSSSIWCVIGTRVDKYIHGTEERKNGPLHIWNTIYDRNRIMYQWRRDQLFTKWCWSNWLKKITILYHSIHKHL